MKRKKIKLILCALLVIMLTSCQLAGDEDSNNNSVEDTDKTDNLLCGFWIVPSQDNLVTETFSPDASGIMMYTYLEIKWEDLRVVNNNTSNCIELIDNKYTNQYSQQITGTIYITSDFPEYITSYSVYQDDTFKLTALEPSSDYGPKNLTLILNQTGTKDNEEFTRDYSVTFKEIDFLQEASVLFYNDQNELIATVDTLPKKDSELKAPEGASYFIIEEYYKTASDHVYTTRYLYNLTRDDEKLQHSLFYPATNGLTTRCSLSVE